MKSSEKDYWRGKGPKPKTRCTCQRYMRNLYVQATIEGVQTTVKVGLICKCGKFKLDQGGLDKLPE